LTIDHVLRVEVVARGDVDVALASLGQVRLERRAGQVLLTCPDASLATAALARAGLSAAPADQLSAGGPLRTALVSHLDPLRAEDIVDVIHLRCPPLGEAITLVRAATRDLFGRRERERREMIAALLHERDRLIAWRRVIHAPASVLRARRMRGVRPLVFDRDGLAHAGERTVLASRRALAAWIAS